jgi:hypothetical protein
MFAVCARSRRHTPTYADICRPHGWKPLVPVQRHEQQWHAPLGWVKLSEEFGVRSGMIWQSLCIICVIYVIYELITWCLRDVLDHVLTPQEVGKVVVWAYPCIAKHRLGHFLTVVLSHDLQSKRKDYRLLLFTSLQSEDFFTGSSIGFARQNGWALQRSKPRRIGSRMDGEGQDFVTLFTLFTLFTLSRSKFPWTLRVLKWSWWVLPPRRVLWPRQLLGVWNVLQWL